MINNRQEYNRALERAAEIWNDSSLLEELFELSDAIEEYERAEFLLCVGAEVVYPESSCHKSTVKACA